MIDSLVKVSEKLADLLEYRARRRREIYTELVAPVYCLLQVAHSDYLAMFERCIEGLDGRELPLVEVACAFASERRGNETIRRDISAKAKVFGNGGLDKAYGEFFTAVSDYLAVPRIEPIEKRLATVREEIARGRLSWSVVMALKLREAIFESEVERIAGLGALAGFEFDVRNETRAVATYMLDAVRTKWEPVAEAHARAQFHGMS